MNTALELARSASPETVTDRDGWWWRSFEIAAAAAGLVVLSPLLAGVALAIAVMDRNPPFFVQRRVGRHGRCFPIVKFRTMAGACGSVAECRPLLHPADDPRSTRIGRALRGSHLDELPQLLNVLAGHMSLVGPRPLIPSEDSVVTGVWKERHLYRPGITGAWQVHRSALTSVDELVALDQRYIVDWTPWRDMRLLALTACSVVTRPERRRAGR